MEHSIFKYIWRYTKRTQLWLMLVTAVSLPFYYFSLDLPKTIVNKAIGGSEFPVFFGIDYSQEFGGDGGFVLGMDLDQISYLLVLSFMFLGLVFINGGFKYYINVLKGRLGEGMLRRMRYQLYERILRFPLPHFRRTSQGELIPMITQEVEPLGGFIGDAFALPAHQGGMMLTLLIFMFVQDPVLGAFAVALYPVQGYIIPKLQRKVNQLGKERVQLVRRLSERIGESVSGVADVHANNIGRLMLARFTAALGQIYDIRYEIYQRKFFIKFLNNFLGQLTPFFFYAAGGYQVIQGELTLGALVAVLAAYKDLSAPWRELLNYYQRKEDSRIKYEQVIEQFQPEGMLEAEILVKEPEEPVKGTLAASNLSFTDEDGSPVVSGINLEIEEGRHVAVVGAGGSGADMLALLMARLMPPTTGRVSLGGTDLANLPESVTGRHVAYVGGAAYVFSASLTDNILLGLQHRPPDHPDAQRRAEIIKAIEAGNSADDPEADWIDRARIAGGDGSGEEGRDEDGEDAALRQRIIEVVRVVALTDDAYQLGLRGTVDSEKSPALAENILEARRRLEKRVGEAGDGKLVERFHISRYNSNATLAENLLFGTPTGEAFRLEQLPDNPQIVRVLKETGLYDTLLDTGLKVAQTMVELFADLPPGHEFFERFGFISAEELPDYQHLISRSERSGLDQLGDEDRRRLLILPFQLIPARHRLGMLDEAMQTKILDARRLFAETLPEDQRDQVAFFDADAYNPAATIQDNILFGKVAYGQAAAQSEVRRLVGEVLDELGLDDEVIRVGLDFQVGVGGARLSAGQRQRLSLARALIRRPAVLIVSEATTALDQSVEAKVVSAVLGAQKDQTVLWVLNRPQLAEQFDQVVVMEEGRIVQTGQFDTLKNDAEAPLARLLG